MRKSTLCTVVATLLVSAALLLIFSIVLFALVPSLIRDKIVENAPLYRDSDIIKKWTNPKYVIELNIWTYSVTNADRIVENGDKPALVKKGPYVFSERLWKEIIEFTNVSTVRYRSYKSYHFEKTKSCNGCQLDDRVRIPNMIFQKFVEAASKPELKLAGLTLSLQAPFLDVSVADLLFDGYKEPFLGRICGAAVMNIICEKILQLPERIGFFFKKNDTADGIYEIATGEGDVTNIGRVVGWNSAAELPIKWWSNEQSRMINGTDGSIYHPHISVDEKLPIFVSDLCRSLVLTFKEKVEWRGIDAYRFTVPASSFDTSLPENFGFCNPNGKRFFSESVQPDSCLPPGLLDISRCQQGEPPIVISLPNFLYAPDEVRQSVIGIDEANEDTDEIVVDIEPQTGAVLSAKRRSQINVAVWKGDQVTFPVDLSRFKSAIIPVLMMNESVDMDDETVDELHSKLLSVQSASFAAAWFLLILSFVLFGLAIYIYFYLYRRNDQNSRMDFAITRNGSSALYGNFSYRPSNINSVFKR